MLIIETANTSQAEGAGMPLGHGKQAGPFGAQLGPTVTPLSHSVDVLSLH